MDYIYLEEVDSTNKYVKEHVDKLSDCCVIYTNKQFAGRGRFDRKWEAHGDKNLYSTILLKPATEFKESYSNLTQFLCLIISEVIEDYGVKANIKWPNDIRINGKKIAGILAECIVSKNKLEAFILGFGVNLNCDKEFLASINQPATSLNIEAKINIDSNIFLKKVIDKFCLGYNKFIEEGFISIKSEYVKRAEFLNMPVTVKVYDKVISGFANDITDSGALKIVDKNNDEHVLLIGDIL